MLSGASLTFAYAPFSLWPVALIAMAVAIRQLRASQRPFLTSWLFGLGWFGAGISWVHVSIADFGGLPIVLSVLLMLILCGYLALYPAFAMWLTKRYFPTRLWPLALPFIWVVAEWLRSWMFTGFPWLSLGYSQTDSLLAGWMPVIGETGVTALVIALATSLALVKRNKRVIYPCLLFSVCFVSGFLLKQVEWVVRDKSYNVAMVQGNIAQSLRWVPEQDGPTMEKYRNLTAPLWQSDLIIWPEAAVPKLELMATGYLAELDKKAYESNSGLITGIVNYNWESEEAWNNLLVLGKTKPTDTGPQYHYFHNNRYAKHHLLPVGEFVPFEDILRPLAPLFDLPMSSFSRGDYEQPNLVANGIHLAPAICFEIAFPRQVAANVHANTDMIVTVSNDAWFGHSHGPAQHLEIARVRAIEFGRPVLRATNNGITAFINEKGDVDAVLPQFEAASISATVQAQHGLTPYNYFGDLLVWALSALGFAIALFLSRKQSTLLIQQESN
ncbi:apolipoprotein N-acyltransferase [Aestuariibacter sp. A3R04]|nr:apolipoprotein N-acyltransferase [Aestuariibacter sp. A3R04]